MWEGHRILCGYDPLYIPHEENAACHFPKWFLMRRKMTPPPVWVSETSMATHTSQPHHSNNLQMVSDTLTWLVLSELMLCTLLWRLCHEVTAFLCLFIWHWWGGGGSPYRQGRCAFWHSGISATWHMGVGRFPLLHGDCEALWQSVTSVWPFSISLMSQICHPWVPTSINYVFSESSASCDIAVCYREKPLLALSPELWVIVLAGLCQQNSLLNRSRIRRGGGALGVCTHWSFCVYMPVRAVWVWVPPANAGGLSVLSAPVMSHGHLAEARLLSRSQFVLQQSRITGITGGKLRLSNHRHIGSPRPNLASPVTNSATCWAWVCDGAPG